MLIQTVAQGLRACAAICGIITIVAASPPHAFADAAIATTHVGLTDQTQQATPTLNQGPFLKQGPFLRKGPLHEKWTAAARAIDLDLATLAACELGECPSPAAQRFLAIARAGQNRDGRAQLGEINRTFNLAIRAVSDLSQYGELDVWTSPLQTLAQGAGDCEDYAIAKYIALRYIGFPSDDLRLVIVRDELRQEDHAVLTVRFDERWIVLDNRRMTMIEMNQMRHARPLFAISDDGIRQYTDDAAPVAGKTIFAAPATIVPQSPAN